MRRKALFGVGVGAVVLALIAGISVMWPGLDAQETPPQDSAVWALQTGDGRRYARVNTAVDELDTVRQVANPTEIVQADSGAYLYTDNGGRVATLDAASPADLDEDTLKAEAAATPPGTQDVETAGEYAAYRTETGLLFAGELSAAASQVNPDKDAAKTEDSADADADAQDVPDYVASAATVGYDGVVYAYSPADGAVLRYSIRDQRELGRDKVGKLDGPLQMTVVGDTWVLYDAESQQLRIRGAKDARKLELSAGAVFSTPMRVGDAAYVADEFGLQRLPLDGDRPERVFGDDQAERGTPARPAAFEGTVYAAWLGSEDGVMWNSDGVETPLSYGGKTLDDTRAPRLTASGSAMILNETRSGWVWTVPEGRLIPSSQDWSLDQQIDEEAPVSEVQAAVVLDPKPPVAVNDAFGVRAGSVVSLPVMLNDHDPNEDVLSVDPASVTGLAPEFGSTSLTDDGGRITVHVSDTATGSASFAYRVTDGTSEDGLLSEPATVTLTVAPPETNAPPVFCGVSDCLAAWPEPEVKPGGTVRVPVLNSWVDPEGDPLLLLSVDNPSEVGSAAVTQTGDVVFQHSDPSTQDTVVVDLEVTVADARGAQSAKALKVKVTPGAQLRAEGFTVVDTAGADLSIDVSPHVTATAGDVAVDTARILDGKNAQVTVAPGTTTFDFSAKDPGVYQVAYTVKDSSGVQADAIARITLQSADAPAALSTAPVVAYVRPQEDATIDVFAAVSNPTRRVLLLSEVDWVPEPGASLEVDAVGQQLLRVSGTTATGDPGRLGVIKYTVGDGSDDLDARVTGQATVYLLPPPQDFAPIAVNDSVTARVGAQIDLPVLDNDVAPSGAALMLDPSTVKTGDDGSLAFASGTELRYLAPRTPGSYVVEYGVYSAGSPKLLSTAKVTVNVIGNESNRPPRPKVLEGRVLAGHAVTIPFSTYGVDPDGDEVVIDRILTSPPTGSASIASDGSGIVYSAAPGSHGQVSFTYRVTDTAGESRSGVVRVGVLDEQSDPAPVTFTDYVQVQVGAKSQVNVTPTANDIDPAGGELKLKKVVPNLVKDLGGGQANPEYAAWESLIRSSNDSTVVIGAGTEPGTMSFLYDVESSTGNEARGRIVVKVVRDAVPDYPVVTDSVLNVETREQFVRGVDVMAGKVSWTSGDAKSLKLSLWGDPTDVEVKGTTIAGPLPKRARVIPFRVTGTAQDGGEVSTYAFLRVPGDDDLQIALKANLAPFDVIEKESVSFDMNKITAIPRGSKLEVNPKASTMMVRPSAACTVDEASGVVTYDAGEGAPWSDACLVQARVEGQEQWTVLSVPIRVTAIAPVPTLRAGSMLVSPGGTGTFDLKTLVTWQGREDWNNLQISADAPGGDFTLTQEGTEVTVSVADSARPGVESASTVSVSSHENVAPSRLNLRVGAAPDAQPRAGTVQAACSASSGSSCTFNVVGAAGEVNPLPNTPLRLIGVSGSSTCTGVTFSQVDSSNVQASWTGDAPGATCTASFTLEDAQGRPTAGDRTGQILFDFRGFPRAPASLTQVAFGDGTLQLQVDPGAARTSYPAVTGYRVTGPDTSVTCSADGTCPAISAPNGEKRAYQAVAVNEVGSSAQGVATEAWSYRPPNAPTSFSAVPVPNGPGGGRVTLTLSGIDASQTRELQISAGESGEKLTVPVAAGQTTVSTGYNVNSNAPVTVSAVPASRYPVPPGQGPNATVGNAVTTQAFGIGEPQGVGITQISEVPVDRRTSRVTVSATAAANGVEPTIYISQGDSCGTTPGATATFEARRTVPMNYTVCAASVYQGAVFATAQAGPQSFTPTGDTTPPSGGSFTVGKTPVVESNGVRWDLTGVSLPPAPAGYESRSTWTSAADFPYGRDPEILMWFAATDTAGDESQRAQLPAGDVPYQMRASWELRTCKVGDAVNVSSGGQGVEPVVNLAGATFTVDGVDGVPMPQNGKVPAKATAVKIPVTVTPGGTLAAYSTLLQGPCG